MNLELIYTYLITLFDVQKNNNNKHVNGKIHEGKNNDTLHLKNVRNAVNNPTPQRLRQ